MTAKAIESLSQQIVEGRPARDLEPLVDELFESQNLDDEDLVSLYKHLPRPLTKKYVNRVLQVDGSGEVAHLLLSSDFDGLDELRLAKRPGDFLKLVDQVLKTVTEKFVTASTSTSAQYWRKYLLEAKSTEADLEFHAVALVKTAVLDAHTFIFEPILDALDGISLKGAVAKNYSTLLKDVLVAGSGTVGLAKFDKAAGSFLKDEGLSGEVSRKARLLSFCSFLKSDSTVSFDDLKKQLNVDSDSEVESSVVDASLARIIDAAVNKEERNVQVHFVEHLRFDKDAWNHLSTQLGQWKKLTEKCIEA